MVDKQQYAITQIKEGKNIFLTGSGGVGKSWVIRQATDKHTVLVAPTGIAALNIGGITCHKAFGLPIGIPQRSDYKASNRNVNKLFGHMSSVKRIIIDEVGMLRADYFDLIDHRLRVARKNNLPFGGIQVVVVGDFFQLEPIVSKQEQPLFSMDYTTPFAFGAKCWNFETVELDKVYRQEDETQVSLLNSVRRQDDESTSSLSTITQISNKELTDDYLHLCAYKYDASIINDRYYNNIQGKGHTYKAITTGKWNESEKPVDDVINLKVGCKVLLCANDVEEGMYVNGDRGVVVDLHTDYVSVLLDSGKHILVGYNSWDKYKYTTKANGTFSKEVDGVYKQLPIRLGWAIVIHKAQGMTLDKISINLGKGCFSHGQLYVALSRAKDLRNIHLPSPLRSKDLIVRQEVKDFYDRQANRDKL